MKKIGWCFICMILLSPTVLNAQPAWDSTYRPDIYRHRVQLFKSFRASTSDVVFLGDSITFWADWSELFGNRRYKNRGIPGDISFGLIERLEDALAGKPAKLFILIGINDLARNIPVDVLMRNHERIIDMAKALSPRTKIFVQSMLPVNDSLNKMKAHTSKAGEIIFVNNRLRELADEKKISFIDLYPGFADSEGKLKSEYTWDGVHLTASGYQHWKQVLLKGNYLK